MKIIRSSTEDTPFPEDLNFHIRPDTRNLSLKIHLFHIIFELLLILII